ncbi:CBASS cGAMP synthase [Gillisia hiemivivida]|uniref:Cyclic GMP-AMP synthase n=1 Tax=Gillisia hiemivivida TaxID=291190 RepID=A0A5C6ZYQ7_9FLAO|nr:nucleotidyltransferase [Gillisia hiemivivida]
MYQVLKIAVGGIVIHQLTKTKPLKINNMANCNKLFLNFNEKLEVTPSKVEKIKTARENIKTKIIEHFKEKSKYNFKGTWIQGSYKMGTMIRTKDDTCDLDLGVYFDEVDPDVTASTVMDQVYKAVENITSTTTSKKGKCIRVIYKGDFHIDLPVYHFNKDEHSHPNLATSNNGWNESDPKDFYIWFNNHPNLRQLKRLVRYLKAWSDNTKGKFPSGLAFSIWAVEHLKSNDRDDIALYEVIKKIKDQIDSTWFLEMPVTPYDDVCRKLTTDQKSNFLDAIADFIDDAKKAIESDNQLESSKLWRKYLGDRFPEGEDEDIDAKEAALRAISKSVLSGTAYSQKSGLISENSEGVKHKPHTNYGG